MQHDRSSALTERSPPLSHVVRLPAARSGNKVERPCGDTTASYKRGNAFGLDSRAWTYRERAGLLYDCATPRLTMLSVRAKSARASELAACARPIELSLGLARLTELIRARQSATVRKGNRFLCRGREYRALFSLRSWSDFIYLV